MRISVVTRSTPFHSTGGMERVALDLALAWSDSGHRVRIVTTPLPSGVSPPPGLPCQIVTLPGTPGRYTAGWARRVAAFDFDDDIVLSVSSAARRLAKSRPDQRIVMQAHGTSWDEIVTKWRTRSPRSLARLPRNVMWLGIDAADYRRYDAVVGVGPTVTKTLMHSMPRRVRPRQYREILNGVSVDARPDDLRRSGVLFVGRVHQEKGVDLAVRAIHGTGLALTVCGDGPYLNDAKRLAESLGVSQQVTFTGRLDAAAVRHLMRSSSAVVVPTRRVEGLPLAVLEALVEGTPVVASSQLTASFTTGLPFGVTEGGDTVESIRAALVRTVDGSSADHGGIAAASERFNVLNTAREYVDFFSELAGPS